MKKMMNLYICTKTNDHSEKRRVPIYILCRKSVANFLNVFYKKIIMYLYSFNGLSNNFNHVGY